MVVDTFQFFQANASLEIPVGWILVCYILNSNCISIGATIRNGLHPHKGVEVNSSDYHEFEGVKKTWE